MEPSITINQQSRTVCATASDVVSLCAIVCFVIAVCCCPVVIILCSCVLLLLFVVVMLLLLLLLFVLNVVIVLWPVDVWVQAG